MSTPLRTAASSKLLTDLRRTKIVEYVEERGVATSEELVERFGVSLMTVWRDLTSLDASGRLRKIRGGATRLNRLRDAEPLYVSKQVLNRERKELIAHYAANHLIDDGDIIFLEAGTTVAAMVKHLARRNLTVVGNGLGTMNELASRLGDISVYCCGGMLRDVAHTFVGPQAEEFFRHINARTCFLSATGLAFPEGFTDPHPLEIQIKRAMAASAARVAMLIDSTKLGVKSLTRILPLEEVDIVVTDSDAPPEYAQKLEALGLEVHIAQAA